MGRTLSTQQIERYRRDGILFPIAALADDEVSKLRSAFEEWESRMGPNPETIQSRQLHLYFRWAYDLATHPFILDAVEDLLGPDILVHSTTVFSKRPHDLNYVSWHQDGYYWRLDSPRLVSAWVALTDSTRSNGCVRVVPGSHSRGLMDHAETARYEHNLLTSGLEVAVDLDETQALDVSLRAGELSLHHVHIVHGSNPNRSETKRVGFAIRYAAPEVRQAIGHHEVILARGRDAYHHFAHLEKPPGTSLEAGLALHSEMIRRLKELRLSNRDQGDLRNEHEASSRKDDVPAE